MEEIDDIDNLEVNNDLTKTIKDKLVSIRNKLKISFIGKLSTPKNLFIEHLTNIDFSSECDGKIIRKCVVISKWDESSKFYKKNPMNSKYCGVFCNEKLTMMSIEIAGSYLNDNNNNFRKCELYLSENSILKDCIIYKTPPIGQSDEIDKFIVEECYKSCYLYVFVINAEESILEEEIAIIKLLMKRRNIIEVKFVIACSWDISREDYINIEQHYNNKIKEIRAKIPGIIIISGHGYISNVKQSENNIETSESNLAKNSTKWYSTTKNYVDAVSRNISNVAQKLITNWKSDYVVPDNHRIEDLGNFIREKPNENAILEAVKNYKLKMKSSYVSPFVENNKNIKRELQKSIENFEKIINFISKSVTSKELKKEVFQFTKTIRSISLDKIYGSNYVIFGYRLTNSSDILRALIGRNIPEFVNLKEKFSIKCNYIKTNCEYFDLQNKKYTNIHELNNLSELISELKLIKNENISIELYLDYEIHPIIKDEMKIIYYSDFDITNEKLLKECEDYDKIAVIIDYKSDTDNNKINKINGEIINYCQTKLAHVQIYIQTSSLEKLESPGSKPQMKLDIKNKDWIEDFYFYISFDKLLSNLKYRKTINEIILLFKKFISHLAEPIIFDVNIKNISDSKFQQLYKNVNSKLKSIKNQEYENILNILNEEINKFVNNIFLENMNISDEISFPGIKLEDELKDPEILNKSGFLNKTKMIEKINKYISNENTRKIWNNSENYKQMLNDIIHQLKMKDCK